MGGHVWLTYSKLPQNRGKSRAQRDGYAQGQRVSLSQSRIEDSLLHSTCRYLSSKTQGHRSTSYISCRCHRGRVHFDLPSD